MFTAPFPLTAHVARFDNAGGEGSREKGGTWRQVGPSSGHETIQSGGHFICPALIILTNTDEEITTTLARKIATFFFKKRGNAM